MIFAEALTEADHYRQFTRSVSAPILANMTEFGKSPLLSVDELRDLGIQLILYPLTAFRAMNAAAELTYGTLREKGIQSSVVQRMQTREDLYDLLDYHRFEQEIDAMADQNS